MIGTEVAVFAALFGAGLGAGVTASFLLALGQGSRVARAVSDFVTPPVVGLIYFLTLRAVASGVFRLYSLLAFLLGGALARLIVRGIAPYLSRLLDRAKVPIKSLEDRVSAWAERRLAPIRARRDARRAARKAKRKRAARREGE